MQIGLAEGVWPDSDHPIDTGR
jgi:hypothetical protein